MSQLAQLPDETVGCVSREKIIAVAVESIPVSKGRSSWSSPTFVEAGARSRRHDGGLYNQKTLMTYTGSHFLLL